MIHLNSSTVAFSFNSTRCHSCSVIQSSVMWAGSNRNTGLS